MKNVFEALLLFMLIITTYVLFSDRDQIHARIQTLVYGLPCSHPLLYSIGTIDSRFKLDHAEVEAIIKNAADAWNTTSGKDLLEETNINSTVVINFVYDKRQEATQKLNVLDSVLSEKSDQYQSLQIQLQTKKLAYTNHKTVYDVTQKKLQQDLKEYNAVVNSYNEKGGAPNDVYTQLATARHILDEREAALQKMADSINAEALVLQNLTNMINTIAKTHNTTASNYNAINSATGSEFEEGQYMTDGKTKTIEIYQFSDRAKLLRVLEHELGHALGLEHVFDANAIMYKLNQSSSNVPVASDLVELARVCSVVQNSL